MRGDRCAQKASLQDAKKRPAKAAAGFDGGSDKATAAATKKMRGRVSKRHKGGERVVGTKEFDGSVVLMDEEEEEKEKVAGR